MAKFNEQHVFTGMQRDIDVSRHPASFLYDARNIRLTQRDGEGDTLYAITNEKGTELTSISIVGNYLGHALLNQYLVVFSRDDSGVAPPGHDESIPDWITRIDLSTLTKRTLYQGDLNFDLDYPISAIGYYENENIQKVYWVDGKNQPRVINIVVGYINQNVDTQFDFLPTLSLNEKIYVTKQTSATGSFPPGVIQYMFTYYRKFGQESNIFYTTPLLYISPLDRGGAPDEKISNSFKIEIKNIDTDHNFDYIRIYSLQRTSKDGTPIAKMVRDIAILPNITAYTFIDTGAEGESIDPAELLYKQREAVIVNTLEQKDNTIFFGDIQYEHEAPPEIPINNLNRPIITIAPSTRTLKFVETDNSTTYAYYNQLNATETRTLGNEDVESSVSCGGFKRGEYYRLGVQFQDKFGKWSDPLYIDDVQETNWPAESSSPEYNITLPTFTGTIPWSYVNTLISMGYKKARAVVVFPDIQDREILCQGVTCPTVYRPRDVSDSAIEGGSIENKQCQSSWFFRPVHSNEDYLISQYGATAPTYSGEIPTSAEIVGRVGVSAGTIATPPRRWEIQGYYNPSNRFCVASSTDGYGVDFSTFHSPDVEYSTDVISQSFNSTMYKIVGYTEITKTFSDIDIQTKSPTISNMGGGFDHHSLVTDGAKGIISGLFYDDFVVDEMSGSTPPYFRDYDKEQSSVKWLVYPWHRSGSLNNDVNRPADAGTRSAELLKKKISNLRYGVTSWIKNNNDIPGTPSTPDSTLPRIAFESNKYPEVFMGDSVSVLKMKDTIYKGNVDTVLMPDLPDGYYFCFNDSITDKSIREYIINNPNKRYAIAYGIYVNLKDKSDAFTNPMVAANETEFTSESWWKTFAILDGQTSSSSTVNGTVRVTTDFGNVFIQRKTNNSSYVNEGSIYTGKQGTPLVLNVVPQNGYSVLGWKIGGPEGKIIEQFRERRSIQVTVGYGTTLYHASLLYTGETSSPANTAHIHLSPSPIDAGIVTGEGDYAVGSTVTISATANSGYTFAHWKNSENVIISTESSTSITVPSSGGSYTAYFAPEGKKGVTFTLSPSDGGWLYVNSDNPPSGTTMYYDEGTVLNINVVSDSESGYELDYLEIDGNRISGNTTTLTVTTNHTVTAVFVNSTDSTQEIYYNDAQGNVIELESPSDTDGPDVPSGYQYEKPIGSPIYLMAQPKNGFILDHWELDGANVGSSNPYSLIVTSNLHQLRAVFATAPSGIKVYVTSNVVDEAGGYASITVGSSSYTIDSSYKTAAIDYVEGMIMSISSSSTKTFSKWQYSTDGVTYTDVPSSGNVITVSGQESDCYYKAIFN